MLDFNGRGMVRKRDMSKIPDCSGKADRSSYFRGYPCFDVIDIPIPGNPADFSAAYINDTINHSPIHGDILSFLFNGFVSAEKEVK